VCIVLQALAICNQLGIRKMIAYISSEDDQLSTAMTHVLQNILNSITDLENIKKEREKHETTRKSDPSAKLRPFPFVFEKICELHVCCLVEVIVFKLLFAYNTTFLVTETPRGTVVHKYS